MKLNIASKPIISTVPILKNKVPSQEKSEDAGSDSSSTKTLKPGIIFKLAPKKVNTFQSETETESEMIENDAAHLGPSIMDIKRMTDREHVYVKQGMYITSDKKTPREEWLYDFETGKIIKRRIDFVPGCERIFLEILSNASDAVSRSYRSKVNPGKIIITMNNKTISIKSFGLPMNVEWHPIEKMWGPEINFGCLRAGQNLEGERNEIGTNGIGSKAANIFSLKFTAIVHDHVRMKRYTQIWDTNMINKSDPLIENYPGKISSVEVIYEMDFARFGYPIPDGEIGGYEKDAFDLFARHAMDASFTAKVPVVFNDLEFNFPNIRDYARLYFGDAVDTAIVHYQWPEEAEVVKKTRGHQTSKNKGIRPLVELLAIDTPDNGDHVSFVNCMMTRQGGIHIDAAFKAVGSSMVKMINEDIMKKLTKHNKGKELDAKEKKAHTINISDVKPHVSILLSTHLKNVDFDSQSKTKLTASDPKPKIKIEENELKGINKWELKDRLMAALEAKQYKSLTKDAKDKKYKAKNHLPANDSKSNDPKVRHRCTLCVTEGDSGDGYAVTLISITPNGRDTYGTLPLRGKGLNVMNASLFQIEKNAEIKELNTALGLVPGTDYSIQANFDKLKYGKLMIMADADVDGKHITGLILNYFHCRFPALLARGFVDDYITPIISATRGGVTMKFYSERSYIKWKNNIPANEKWEFKYYKGLGSSKDEDVEYDKAHPFIIKCQYDDKAKQYFELAFHKKLANERKEWITNHVLAVDDYESKLQPISWFIDNELVLFSLDNLPRSIAKMTDGQKESHTKIIHGTHKKWPTLSGKEMKVAQFAGYIAGETNYHHGELILGGVITKMAQDFTGANNIAYFFKDGQFGSKLKGGRDAANPRYTHTRPLPILKYIFNKEDRPLLEYREEEGEKIEPKTYIPVVPMVLINGTQGIATGWSSTVPSHNPIDIVKSLRLLLEDVEELPPLIPWFRGFKGTIEILDRRKNIKPTIKKVDKTEEIKEETKEETSEEDEEEIEEFKDDGFVDDDLGNDAKSAEDEVDDKPKISQKFSVLTRGIFEVDNKGTITITELPVGRWPFNYNKWLEKLKDEKKIKDYKDSSGKDDVYFEIYGFKGTPTHKSLKLERPIGMSNMFLLDQNLRPKKYNSANDILKAFFEWRLPLYQKRKDYNLKVLDDEIEFLNYKTQFIRAVIDKSIIVIDKSQAEVHAVMDTFNIPHEIYKKSKTWELNKEGIEDCLKEIEKKKQEREAIEQVPIKEMWLKDLDDFEQAYLKEYEGKAPKKTTRTGKGKATTAKTTKTVAAKPAILTDKPAQEKALTLFAKSPIKPVVLNKTLIINKTSPIKQTETPLPITVQATIPVLPAKFNEQSIQTTIPVLPVKVDPPVIEQPAQTPVKIEQPTPLIIPVQTKPTGQPAFNMPYIPSSTAKLVTQPKAMPTLPI